MIAVDTSALVAIVFDEPERCGLPLLCKGGDFIHTDIQPAVVATSL